MSDLKNIVPAPYNPSVPQTLIQQPFNTVLKGFTQWIDQKYPAITCSVLTSLTDTYASAPAVTAVNTMDMFVGYVVTGVGAQYGASGVTPALHTVMDVINSQGGATPITPDQILGFVVSDTAYATSTNQTTGATTYGRRNLIVAQTANIHPSGLLALITNNGAIPNPIPATTVFENLFPSRFTFWNGRG
jgi:hypothetical protein